MGRTGRFPSSVQWRRLRALKQQHLVPATRAADGRLIVDTENTATGICGRIPRHDAAPCRQLCEVRGDEPGPTSQLNGAGPRSLGDTKTQPAARTSTLTTTTTTACPARRMLDLAHSVPRFLCTESLRYDKRSVASVKLSQPAEWRKWQTRRIRIWYRECGGKVPRPHRQSVQNAPADFSRHGTYPPSRRGSEDHQARACPSAEARDETINLRRLLFIAAGVFAHTVVIVTLIVLWTGSDSDNVTTTAEAAPGSTEIDGSVGSVAVGGITLRQQATSTSGGSETGTTASGSTSTTRGSTSSNGQTSTRVTTSSTSARRAATTTRRRLRPRTFLDGCDNEQDRRRPRRGRHNTTTDDHAADRQQPQRRHYDDDNHTTTFPNTPHLCLHTTERASTTPTRRRLQQCIGADRPRAPPTQRQRLLSGAAMSARQQPRRSVKPRASVLSPRDSCSGSSTRCQRLLRLDAICTRTRRDGHDHRTIR